MTESIAMASRQRPGRRWIKLATGGVLIVMALLAIALAVWIVSLGPVPLKEAEKVSTVVVDHDGKLLRAYAMADGRWRLPVDAKTDVDPGYITLLLAYEDQRFYSHGGVDPWALLRAARQWVTQGHIVSGGSTITMQLARLIEPRRRRSLYAKLHQIVRALEIERELDKDQILNLYLTLAPYGGNLEGVRAASLAYFGKEPRHLSLAEAALLVALPQSPERRRADRHPEAARAARDRVLDRMVEEGQISPGDAAEAKRVPVPRLRKQIPILAPHSADRATATLKGMKRARLMLYASPQRRREALAKDRAAAPDPDVSVAILASGNKSGDGPARRPADPGSQSKPALAQPVSDGRFQD